MKVFLPFFCILIGTPLLSVAQKAIIAGIVKDKNEVLIGAALVLENSSHGTATDIKGNFKMEGIEPGTYVLVVSYIGHKPFQKQITLGATEQVTLHVMLEEDISELNSVEVYARSEGAEVRESPQTVSVMEARQFYTQSASTADLINRMAGVRVRQDGGLGSTADFSINGISGKQVKFFIDGIPVDFYGAALGINVIPINLLDRIEVYKGVVPIYLSGDALGGAMNAVTRRERKDYIDAVYSIGSFSTHKASLNSKYFIGNRGFYAGMNSFYNYSANNYKVDVEIPDQSGVSQPATVRRFHDRFSNYFVRTEIGWLGNKYADEVALSLNLGGLHDEIQHDALMSQPYGKASFKENTRGLGLKASKTNLLFKGLSATFFMGYNHSRSIFADTTLNAYTWNGEIFTTRQYGGEINTSMNLLSFYTDNTLSRTVLHYKPNDRNQFVFSNLTHGFFRKGNDPVAARFYGKDIYQNPTSLLKNIAGLSYERSLFQAKLTSISAVKYYYFRSQGFLVNNSNEITGKKQSQEQVGISQAVKYEPSKKWLLKSSYEYATRLPDELELFGNYYLVRPNANLIPEISHNLNLGLLYSQAKLRFELNGFFRQVDNIIYLRTSRFFAQYQNLLNARIKGIEGDVSFTPFPFLFVSANVTYQDLRNKTLGDKSGTIDDRYVNARLPNIPYLFSNCEIRYASKNPSGKKQVQLWWNANYVHEFFLYWAIDGIKDKKAVVPTQFIQNTGISYSPFTSKLTVSFELFNMLNTKAYDNFNVQKSGRAYSVRLRYYVDDLKTSGKNS